MGGGWETVTETTNYVFAVYYSGYAGIQYRHMNVRKLKPELDIWGHRIEEWDIEIGDYNSDEDNYRLHDAFKELENERTAERIFKKMTKDEVTLTEIWGRMNDEERNARIWKERAERAEKVIAELNQYRYEKEDKEYKERKAKEGDDE
jgi:hypothetical protein